jgi:phosphate transport system permease protein
VTANILGPGDTLASVIANQFGEASGTHRAALIGCGVVLFAITILISMAARAVVARTDQRSAGTT